MKLSKLEGLKAWAIGVLARTPAFNSAAKIRALAIAPARKPAKPATAEEVLALCTAASLDWPEVNGILAKGCTLEAARLEVAAFRDRRTALVARAKEITAICQKFDFEELREGFIDGGQTVAQVKASVADMRARIDMAVDIDSSLAPDSGRTTSHLSVGEIYTQRNQRR